LAGHMSARAPWGWRPWAAGLFVEEESLRGEAETFRRRPCDSWSLGQGRRSTLRSPRANERGSMRIRRLRFAMYQAKHRFRPRLTCPGTPGKDLTTNEDRGRLRGKKRPPLAGQSRRDVSNTQL
jgi:hypothetical protein